MIAEINVKISRDCIWGNQDTDGLDVQASESKLERMVGKALARYRNATVTVDVEGCYTTEVAAYDKSNDRQEAVEVTVNSIVDKAWESWDWLVR